MASYASFEERLSALERQLGLDPSCTLPPPTTGGDGASTAEGTTAPSSASATERDFVTRVARLESQYHQALSGSSSTGGGGGAQQHQQQPQAPGGGGGGGGPSSSSGNLAALLSLSGATATGSTPSSGLPPPASSATTSSSSNDLRTTFHEIRQMLEELDPGTALTHQQQITAPILYRKNEILASSEDLLADMKCVSQILDYLAIGQDAGQNPQSASAASPSTQPPREAGAGRPGGGASRGGGGVGVGVGGRAAGASAAPTPQPQRRGQPPGDGTKRRRGDAPSAALLQQLDEQYVTQAPILVETIQALQESGTGTIDPRERMVRCDGDLRALSRRVEVAANHVSSIVEEYHALMNAISERTVQLDDLLTSRGV